MCLCVAYDSHNEVISLYTIKLLFFFLMVKAVFSVRYELGLYYRFIVARV